MLNEKIIGRKYLTFLIEDENGEKFGFYLNDEMTTNEYKKWIKVDNKSFHFNLNKNNK